jgi:hypothetical protein
MSPNLAMPILSNLEEFLRISIGHRITKVSASVRDLTLYMLTSLKGIFFSYIYKNRHMQQFIVKYFTQHVSASFGHPQVLLNKTFTLHTS